MLSPELRSLADALTRTRELLQQHGDTFTVQRLQALENRLTSGDMTAIDLTVLEATGGMGSLNDRYLCIENGDAIQPEEVAAVNARLRTYVDEVEQRARTVAAAHGVPLFR